MLYNIENYLSDYGHVYYITCVLFGISNIITSSEYLAIRKEFRTGGVFSWRILASAHAGGRGSITRKLEPVLGYKGVIWLHLIKLLLSIMLVILTDEFVREISLVVITLILLLFSIRNIYGNDGSDQMTNVVSISLFVGTVSQDPFIFKVSFAFIALQAVISYVIAGFAKLRSSKWRKGDAIFQIMNTRTFGSLSIAKFLNSSSQSMNLFLNWSIIVIEISFIGVIFVPYPFNFIFVILGILFHIYNAIVMGLNNFLWIFLSTYPSLIFVHSEVAKHRLF